MSAIHVSDLPHSGKIKFLGEEDATVAHVTVIREEVAEAEAADAAATPAEPEVAKKGKGETRGCSGCRRRCKDAREEVSCS